MLEHAAEIETHRVMEMFPSLTAVDPQTFYGLSKPAEPAPHGGTSRGKTTRTDFNRFSLFLYCLQAATRRATASRNTRSGPAANLTVSFRLSAVYQLIYVRFSLQTRRVVFNCVYTRVLVVSLSASSVGRRDYRPEEISMSVGRHRDGHVAVVVVE